MVPILQPYQVASPDGTWVLDVKPGNREAAGPAATTLTHTKTGQIAWKRMLPYTFWQCCVNNDGVVGGFAYTKGVMGENDSTKDAGNFIVSFLDNQGKEHTIETNDISASIAVNELGHVFAKISEEFGANDDKKDPLAGHYLRFTPDGVLEGKPLDPPKLGVCINIVAQPKTNNLIFYGYEGEIVVNRDDPYGSHVATLTHRADGQWLECIQDVSCSLSGSIAVRDTSKGDTFGGFTTPSPRLPNKLPAETITLYTKDGDLIRTIDFSRFAGLSEIAFDGKHLAATFPSDPPTPLIYLFDSDGTPVGAIKIADLADKKSVNLRAFIVSGGNAILAVDQKSGMAFRFAMP